MCCLSTQREKLGASPTVKSAMRQRASLLADMLPNKKLEKSRLAASNDGCMDGGVEVPENVKSCVAARDLSLDQFSPRGICTAEK